LLSQRQVEDETLPFIVTARVGQEREIVDDNSARVRARADSSTVRFYPPGKHEAMKTHARVAPGKRSTDLADFPPEKAEYAARDSAALINRARSHGRAIGEFAQKLFDSSPLPWTRMRQLGMVHGLIKRYGRAASTRRARWPSLPTWSTCFASSGCSSSPHHRRRRPSRHV
jgi:hypothetical protein